MGIVPLAEQLELNPVTVNLVQGTESVGKVKAQTFIGDVTSFILAPKPESQDFFNFLLRHLWQQNMSPSNKAHKK